MRKPDKNKLRVDEARSAELEILFKSDSIDDFVKYRREDILKRTKALMDSRATEMSKTTRYVRTISLLSQAASLEIFALSLTGASQGYRPSFLLDLLVPSDLAEDMQANLGEVFPTWVQRHGLRKAKLICRVQIARLIFGTWIGKCVNTGERLLKAFRIS